MAIPLETLCGPAQVIDLPEVAVITAEVLQAAAPNLACPRVLLRTTNSSRHILHASSFVSDYVALEASGAAWIVDHGATLVGIDAMSVDPFDSETLPAHRRLLENGIIIADGLDLWQALPGRYELVCAPLPIVGADGAPARAWLVR